MKGLDNLSLVNTLASQFLSTRKDKSSFEHVLLVHIVYTTFFLEALQIIFL